MINNLLLLRIDERLNHGQVMISYMKKYPAKAILCIDDKTAADAFLKNIICMSAPVGVTIDVQSVSESIEILKSGLKVPTIIIAKSPLVVKQLRDAGIDIGYFIIGGCAKAPGKVKLYKSIFISEEEMSAVKALLADGVKIDVQIVASDKTIAVQTLLK